MREFEVGDRVIKVSGSAQRAGLELFNFQWLARATARSLFLLFTYSSDRRLFINQSFFEQ
jgi:hypothetical protein